MSFPIDKTIDGLQTVLDLRQQQHSLTAGNLANVDTPGYKARYIRFDTLLSEAMDRGQDIGMARADDRHLGGADVDNPEIVEVEPPPWAEDDNSVLAERETARMVSNSIIYNGVAKGLSKHLAMLKYAASDGRG